jgi:hypothetical protein
VGAHYLGYVRSFAFPRPSVIEEGAEGQAERLGELPKRGERWVGQAAFELADPTGADPGKLGEILDRITGSATFSERYPN